LTSAVNPDTLQIIRTAEKPLDLPVFASYHRNDSERVSDICRFMQEKRNFRIWTEKNLLPGDPLEKAINQAILEYTNSGYVVAFWSVAIGFFAFLLARFSGTLGSIATQRRYRLNAGGTARRKPRGCHRSRTRKQQSHPKCHPVERTKHLHVELRSRYTK
jgi:hypothetical protein